jgi:metal-sulfur cluster biosynthetic enzyme
MARILLKDVVRAASEAVDPEVGINVVDLGLIYGIRVDRGGNVRVQMTMTSPMCPMASAILADVQLRIAHLKGVGKVDLELVWEPLWSPEMMSEETRASLGV